jgi:RimJ/RimL family protein N-acetyltransferase
MTVSQGRSAISWREARREDRPLLQGFTCCGPVPRGQTGRRFPHPKPYEYEVQSFFRDFRPPTGADQKLFLGLRETDLRAAIAMSRQRPDGEIGYVKLQAVAVGISERGIGGSLANEVMEVSLREAFKLASTQELNRVRVVAFVDPMNAQSKRMLARAGFDLRGTSPNGNEYEQWIVEVRPG